MNLYDESQFPWNHTKRAYFTSWKNAKPFLDALYGPEQYPKRDYQGFAIPSGYMVTWS